MRFRTALGGFTAALFATPTVAQFNNQWVSFTKDNTKISSTTISDANNETDLDAADANGDGWIDVVVVRKQPFTSAGKRTNIYLHSVNGVLTNQTTQYASAADVAGDQGFNTPTNDRDIRFLDVNGDGRLDFITATTLSDGEPKHIGHPRVYLNLGGASWAGFRFENARIPQLLHYGTGLPQQPRFCSVGVGDLTGDGRPDMFFGDYDSSGAGGEQQGANEDLDDRLLINDGNGFYTDQSQARMTSDMLLSAFGMASEIDDMNLDGKQDVVKDTALNPPQDVRVIYNNPANQGFFNIQNKFHSGFAPYHVNTGDMNNDGRLDVNISDDNADRYRYNTGNDGLGQVIWGTAKTYQFLTGGDDGFGSEDAIVDFNGDGWQDTYHADIDVDIPGTNRRLHIYHNPGGAIGSQITLLEERQQSAAGGWMGAVGLLQADLQGTHDVMVADYDNDGDKDMIISRYNGTDYYRNNSAAAPCTTPTAYGAGEVSSGGTLAQIGSSGGNPSINNPSFAITLTGGFPSSGAVLLESSLGAASIPAPWGTQLVAPPAIRHPALTSPTGTASYTVPMSAPMLGTTLWYQWLVRDPLSTGAVQHSNGLAVTFCF